MANNRIVRQLNDASNIAPLEAFLNERLELTKAVLEQMKATHLCNGLVDQALADIQETLDYVQSVPDERQP